MSIELKQVNGQDVWVSDREMRHHVRYLGTPGFTNPDGSGRVPTQQEVVDRGWESPSYLVDPIPDEPRIGLCGVGKVDVGLVWRLQSEK